MSHSEQLLRTLLAVASGALASAAAAGCGGQSSSSGGGGGAAGESTTGGASGSVAAGGAAPTGGMSTGGMSTGGMSSGGFVCEDGPALELCKTLDELEDYVANYPGEAQKPPRQEFTVCPPRDIVWDPNTCCNPADRGPEQRGLLCCYGFCELRSCCGRAFSVDERARVAPTARRGDWLLGVLRDNAEGQGGALGADAARAIGGLWLRDAQMEHASIASFARFTLELLALGAPANLLEAAQHATVDEIEHARLCFGVASRFLRSPTGPAPLELAGAEPRTSLAAAAAAATLEGAVGETIAALVAAEQRARCTDESIARVLGRIADDEARHAALAFDFVAWALSVGDGETRSAVERALADGIAQVERRAATCAESADEPTLNHYGRLTAEQERRATLRAIEDVVVPGARKLLGVGAS